MNDQSPVRETASNEEWRDVVGFEGYYRVSSLGKVESLHRGRRLILKGFDDGYGYLQVRLRANGLNRSVKIHKLVAEAFLGPCPVGMEVNHMKGIKTDNRAKMLEYMTKPENIAHAVANGLRAEGENASMAKLSDAQVDEIIRRAAAGESKPFLAKEFLVTDGHIRQLARGNRRKDRFNAYQSQRATA